MEKGAGTFPPLGRLGGLRRQADGLRLSEWISEHMDRNAIIRGLSQRSTPWDVLVIGGGATGLGAAVDAASRGLSTVLVERGDFASGTSSRSTKLVHGGVRYLRQGHFPLVMEALRERGRLISNAPGLVHPLAFIIPVRSVWEKAFYGAGLKLYEGLAGGLSLGPSELVSREEVITALPGVVPDSLRGGVRYWDAQFDDARLALALARTLFGLGGAPLNYGAVESLIEERGRIAGARVTDLETEHVFELRARVVINAAGVWGDALRRLEDPAAPATLLLSQGSHLVLDRDFLPGNEALMVPRTEDGRVLFVIPWMGRCLVGTTDIPVEAASWTPKPLDVELDFLLREAGRWLQRPLRRDDIRSAFAGLRPLVRPSASGSTASASREHRIDVSSKGMISVIGGKWTTYRHMAEEVMDVGCDLGGWKGRRSETAEMRLSPEPMAFDGTAERLDSRLPLTDADVRRSVQQEMACRLEDVLARRSRCLFLDARAAQEIAPRVCRTMSLALGKSESWEREQLSQFASIASLYLP